jgi:hypothetical protein
VIETATDLANVHEIEKLEARIEALAEKALACRKIAVIARVAAVGGALWALALFAGAMRFDPVQMVASLTLALGGIVAMGSNASTLEETNAAIAEAEARRASLIGAMSLRLVD